MATAINVAAGATVDNVNFTLAAGTFNWDGPPFRMVPVKIVVEGGGTPMFQSDHSVSLSPMAPRMFQLT